MATDDQPPADSAGKAPSDPQDGPDSPAGGPRAGDGTDKPQDKITDDDRQTFDRAYVQRLRDEAAGHRVKAKRADTLAARLVTSMAAQTSRLADPTDLAFSPDLLDDDGLPDEAKVADAIEELVARKPHFASRRPAGTDVGQGAQVHAASVSLADLLRRGA